MKIVFASTPSQEEKISELVQHFYSHVFPLYFSDKEIKKFERLKVLHTSSRHFEYFGTLRDAFQVLACLQTLISILESPCPNEHYRLLFSKNALILKEFNLFFPFEYDQFLHARSLNTSIFSIYSKAANELLV